MYVDFNKIPENARVWVYQSKRQLTDNEQLIIENYLKPAIDEWTAHGATLWASAKILYKRFVILALDQQVNTASGCSIDASTRWFQTLGESLDIDFFDRSQAYFDGEELKTFSVFGYKKAVENGLITPETIIFNNISLSTLGDLTSQWQIKAIESPILKRFFTKTLA